MLINASDFGLVGDGVTDNTMGLRRLRDHIRGLEDRPIVVEFGPGHYLYTDNSRNKETGAAFHAGPPKLLSFESAD